MPTQTIPAGPFSRLCCCLPDSMALQISTSIDLLPLPGPPSRWNPVPMQQTATGGGGQGGGGAATELAVPCGLPLRDVVGFQVALKHSIKFAILKAPRDGATSNLLTFLLNAAAWQLIRSWGGVGVWLWCSWVGSWWTSMATYAL